MSDPSSADRSRPQPIPLVPLGDRDRPHAPLPTPLTSFVGREREVAAVVDRLRRADVRLLTLTGPGGVGKTRLAIRAAEVAVADFPDGVWFVPLAPVRDPNLIASTIARTLGVQETVDRPIEERITAFFAARRGLLVLDNFEHVLEAGPLVTDLLAACPMLHVLVTSRTVLRLSGEHAFDVPPLSLPGRAVEESSSREVGASFLDSSEAVRLFVERAAAADAAFVLTDANAADVATLCARLDGLPLAIELAAARARALPPPAMLRRLDQRLRLLTGGARDQPVRLRSLRDAIAWSHDLLTPEEQALFRRLAVFVGGCTLEAAEAVVAAEGEPTYGVLEGIASLTDKSLLRQETEPGGEPRYWMLETVREFGLERIEASGEEAKVRDRHASWCLRLAERIEAAALGSPEQRARFDRLHEDHDNVRAALTWLFDREDATGPRLAAAMSLFWYVRGPLGEARAWLDRALAITASDETPPELRARVLFAAGQAAFRRWDVACAEALLGESVALWREVGDEGRLAAALHVHAGVLPEDDPATLAQLEAALALFRKLAHPLTPYALMDVGFGAHLLGDDARAIALLDEGLAQCRQNGDEWGAGAALFRLAGLALDQGEAARAVAFALEGLNSFWEQGDQAAAVECLACLTGAAAALGRPEPAGRLIGATDRLREVLGFGPTPEYERWDGRAVVRAKLGEDLAAEAFAAGRTMPLADAIAEARALAAELTTAAASAAPAPPAPSGLSPREMEVLRLAADGLSDRAVADALFIGRGTVRTHLASIYSKLEVGSRMAAVAAARRRGIL